MATNTVTAQLTAAHRQAQVQIGAETVAQMSTVWPVLDPTRLDETTEEWLQVAAAVIAKQRQASSELAAVYMEVYRQLELGQVSDWKAIEALGIDLDLLRTSLRVTGPVRLKKLMGEEVPLQTAVDLAEGTSAAAGLRHTLNAGRETLWGSGRADPRVKGWMRVTSGNPCAFCAMLAARGAVYFSQETADFQPHDGCGCFPEPIYGDPAGTLTAAGTEEWSQLWDSSTQGTSGKGSISAFRKAYDAQRNV